MTETTSGMTETATAGAPSRFGIQLFAVSATAPVGWRLLSGNNRESGRGIESFADPAACLEGVACLQSEIHRAVRRSRREANRWVWEFELDGVAVVFAGHSFDRLVRCEQAAAQFLAEFAAAPVRGGVVLTGARRWGSVAS